MNTDNLRLAVCYEAALLTIAPLPRVVFLLCRVDDFSYREIGGRLSIEPALVEDCIVFALVTFTLLWQGELPNRPTPQKIAAAEAVLFQKYHSYCATLIAATRPVVQEISNSSANCHRSLAGNGSGRKSLLCISKWLAGTLLHYLKWRSIPSVMTFEAWLRAHPGAANSYPSPQTGIPPKTSDHHSHSTGSVYGANAPADIRPFPHSSPPVHLRLIHDEHHALPYKPPRRPHEAGDDSRL